MNIYFFFLKLKVVLGKFCLHLHTCHINGFESSSMCIQEEFFLNASLRPLSPNKETNKKKYIMLAKLFYIIKAFILKILHSDIIYVNEQCHNFFFFEHSGSALGLEKHYIKRISLLLLLRKI